MLFTVSHLYNTFKTGLKILSGSGGMSRPIKDAGLLDYELDPQVKDKYFHSNFHENQMVITTLSCIKSYPHLLADAIKHLILKNASGLIIKNVFNLPIPDNVLRYADAHNFPIMLATERNIYVEKLIYTIQIQANEMAELNRASQCLNRLLKEKLSPHESNDCVFSLNPSFSDSYYILFFQVKDFTFDDYLRKFTHIYQTTNLCVPENRIIPYETGFFLVYSAEENADVEELSELFIHGTDVRCGISAHHLTINEFAVALRESLDACKQATWSKTIKYSSLGTMQLVYPFASTPIFKQFVRCTLENVIEHDIEHKSALLETLTSYISNQCSIEATAKELNQHKNTIRYRLEKVKALSGLDYKFFSDLEQLSMAVKIHNSL